MGKKTKEHKKKLKVNKIAIIAIIVIIIVIIIFVKNNKNSETKLDSFEEYAINNYLQENVLDVFNLYSLAGKTDYDETQIFQAKLKTALDTYFSENSKKSISTSEAISLVDETYVPENVDFHGIVISGYEYSEENDTLKKSDNANSSMSDVEIEINSVDYSSKKAIVKNLEKISDTQYKISFEIADEFSDFSISDNATTTNESGIAVVVLKDNTMEIESCTFND